MDGLNSISRRRFLKNSAGIGVAGWVAKNLASANVSANSGIPGSNDRIGLGFIGVGQQGSTLLDQFLKQTDVEVVALCDVWKERLDQGLSKCGGSPKAYHDYRDLLEDPNVDAVVIATPPHWHALQAIHTCQAGKDFYQEKPMTRSIGETLAVVRAVRKHQPITQVGTQIHAGSNYHRVVDIVRSGVLGKINLVRTLNLMNQGADGIGHTPNSDPPEGLDWDLWCGPARKQPFNPLIVKDAYHHGSFMEYSGGWTPGMAPHLLDLPYWALELEAPLSASSSGGRYLIEDAGDAYDTHEVLWQHPGLTMTWSTSLVNTFGLVTPGPDGKPRQLAIAFHGVKGTLIANYDSYEIVPEGDTVIDTEHPPKTVEDSPGHHREWLDCLRTREQPSCHVGYHYKIDIAINLSLISLKLGRSVRFDPDSESIPNDPEAQDLFFKEYREPYRIPTEYL